MLLDSTADARVRSLWRRVAAAGLPSRLLEHGDTPHVSLGVAAGVSSEALLPALEAFAASESPLAVALASVATFATAEGVVFLGVAATRALLELHTRFYPAFERAAREPWSYYRPGIWVPHCTVAYGLAPAEVGRAIEACAAEKLPIAATLGSVHLKEYPSGRVLGRFAFAPS
jgi:2'-5' RNA ligase